MSILLLIFCNYLHNFLILPHQFLFKFSQKNYQPHHKAHNHDNGKDFLDWVTVESLLVDWFLLEFSLQFPEASLGACPVLVYDTGGYYTNV